MWLDNAFKLLQEVYIGNNKMRQFFKVKLFVAEQVLRNYKKRTGRDGKTKYTMLYRKRRKISDAPQNGKGKRRQQG